VADVNDIILRHLNTRIDAMDRADRHGNSEVTRELPRIATPW
jgi:hypothetical protein